MCVGAIAGLQEVSPLLDLLAGSAAGAAAVLLTYPLDLVRTRLAYSTECGSPQPAKPGVNLPASAAGSFISHRAGHASSSSAATASASAAAAAARNHAGSVRSGGRAGGAVSGAALRGVPPGHAGPDDAAAGRAGGRPTIRRVLSSTLQQVNARLASKDAHA